MKINETICNMLSLGIIEKTDAGVFVLTWLLQNCPNY